MSDREPLILIVEDDEAQLHLLKYNIELAGFTALAALSGNEALQHLNSYAPDLVLLDWMIPGINGINLCKVIKQRKDSCQIPVLMISARTEEEDRVRGLDSGADDYVIKPYSISELMARIRALLRRSRPAASGTSLNYQSVELDPICHRVTCNGMEVPLRPTEYRLLEAFIEQPGRVWSRQQLLDRVWGRNIFVEDRTVDVHIGRLRKALRSANGEDPFRTVRGVGYALG
ncbi:MAG: phosphate regulon transcriptional regulator PhoB [Rhodobacteraceae bacterium]|nr:phosphate regulon transcriptional regulator PhoB [Paracoccaceae bacterium]MCY4195962.1 phosphate regulon transcriptional regulator PhoB [Paracoccaceae bacterium]